MRARRRDPGFCDEPGTHSSQRQQKLRDIKKEAPWRRCSRPSLYHDAGHGGARRRGDGVGVMLWQPEKQFFIFEDATVAIKRNNNMLSAHYLLFL